jgi:anti-anti-sigma factor
MLPKFILRRPTSKMKSMNEISNCVLCDESVISEEETREEVGEIKEDRIKLSLEARTTDDGVTIVFCSGRIVYRDEAAALSRIVSRLMGDAQKLVLDLSGVETVDGAGLGEFVGLHNRAATNRCSLKLVALRDHVRCLFEMTKLAPIFEIYPTVEQAFGSFEGAAVSF